MYTEHTYTHTKKDRNLILGNVMESLRLHKTHCQKINLSSFSVVQASITISPGLVKLLLNMCSLLLLTKHLFLTQYLQNSWLECALLCIGNIMLVGWSSP